MRDILLNMRCNNNNHQYDKQHSYADTCRINTDTRILHENDVATGRTAVSPRVHSGGWSPGKLLTSVVAWMPPQQHKHINMPVVKMKMKWVHRSPADAGDTQSAEAIRRHCETQTLFEGNIVVERPARARYTAVCVRLHFLQMQQQQAFFVVTPANRRLLQRLVCVSYRRDTGTLIPIGLMVVLHELVRGTVRMHTMATNVAASPHRCTNGVNDVYAPLSRVRRDGKCLVGFTTKELRALHAEAHASAPRGHEVLYINAFIEPRNDDSDESDDEDNNREGETRVVVERMDHDDDDDDVVVEEVD